MFVIEITCIAQIDLRGPRPASENLEASCQASLLCKEV